MTLRPQSEDLKAAAAAQGETTRLTDRRTDGFFPASVFRASNTAVSGNSAGLVGGSDRRAHGEPASCLDGGVGSGGTPGGRCNNTLPCSKLSRLTCSLLTQSFRLLHPQDGFKLIYEDPRVRDNVRNVMTMHKNGQNEQTNGLKKLQSFIIFI